MADNIVLNSGSGGATLAADDISSVWYQIEKLAFGPLNTATLVTASVGLPVDVKASIALDVSAATVTVDLGANNDVTITGDALTALQLIDDVIFVDDTATHSTGSTKLLGVGAVATPTDAAITANDIGMLAMSLDRRLHVDAAIKASVALDVSAATLTVNAHAVTNAGTFPVQIVDPSFAVGDGNALGEGVLIQGDDGTDRKNLNVDATTGDLQVDITNTVTVAAHAVTNAGTFPVQIDGDALTALQLIDDAISGNEMQVDVLTVLTGSGALNLGKIEDGPHTGGDLGVMALAIRDDALAANAGVGADLDYVPLRTNNDGALWAQLSAGNLGGCKIFNDIDLDEADIDVATGPCTIYAMYVVNTTASILHLKLFNTNAVTMGTTAATASLPIPANADSDGAGFVIPIPACGSAFSTALTVAVTTAAALDDNGAPGAGAAIATIWYQD